MSRLDKDSLTGRARNTAVSSGECTTSLDQEFVEDFGWL
jgi:hypothetical protein